MKRALILALTGLVATVAAGCGKKEAPAGAPPEVYVADVVQKDVPVYMELVGQTRGSQDVEIRARVEGYLNRVAFTEGAFVRKGELLYQIDPLPLEAALANAKAQLATAEARLQKANTDVNRLTPLAKQQAVSQQELDNALSAQDAARAQVDANKAAVDKATLDLGYTRITAPLDGLVGTTEVKAGNLVGRGESTLLTTVSKTDPILFRAGISEAEYLRLGKQVLASGQKVARGAGDRAHPGRRHGSLPRGPRGRHRACGGRDDRDSRRPVHVPEPRPARPPRAVRPGPLRDRDEDGGPPRAPEGGGRAAEPLQRRRGRRGRQGRVPQREGRAAGGEPLGDRGGPEAGREGRGRGPAAGARGRRGEREARGGRPRRQGPAAPAAEAK